MPATTTTKAPKSNVEWDAWSKMDPLFGVASIDGRNRSGANPWTEPEFYAHGAECWRMEQERWERYGVDPTAVVEIGCGAGRMTKQLAGYFRQAYGLDVAPKMLEIAKRNVPEAQFMQTIGTRIPLPDGSVTAAFSCDVFQHFDNVDVAKEYFYEFGRVVRPGGTIMIHMPVHVMRKDVPEWLTSAFYSCCRFVYSSMHGLRRMAIRAGIPKLGSPFMFRTEYERSWVFKTLTDAGFRDIEVLYPNYRSYIFARRA
jgi:ubiquinone/menaquinone biosynthesis C-methylase UbiE